MLFWEPQICHCSSNFRPGSYALTNITSVYTPVQAPKWYQGLDSLTNTLRWLVQCLKGVRMYSWNGNGGRTLRGPQELSFITDGVFGSLTWKTGTKIAYVHVPHGELKQIFTCAFLLSWKFCQELYKARWFCQYMLIDIGSFFWLFAQSQLVNDM